MSENTNQPPFDLAAREIVRTRACRMVGHAGLRAQDREDLEHDLLCELARAWPGYDAARGSWPCFAQAVADRAARSILRKLLSARRGLGRSVPLSELPVELREALGSGRWHAEVARRDLALDVAEAMAGLGAEERALAERLKELGHSEAAREVGVPRTTLASKARRLRARLEGLGPAGGKSGSSS